MDPLVTDPVFTWITKSGQTAQGGLAGLIVARLRGTFAVQPGVPPEIGPNWRHTLVFLAANAADVSGVEPADLDETTIAEALMEAALDHEAAWHALQPRAPVPDLSRAFHLISDDPRDPAWMQVPWPDGLPEGVEARPEIKILPDTIVYQIGPRRPPSGPADLAIRCAGTASKHWYTGGWPTAARFLGQAVGIEIPGRPEWRFLEDVRALLEARDEAETLLGLGSRTAPVRFAWLLPWMPDRGRPIPQRLLHPLFLDCSQPMRLRRDGTVLCPTAASADGMQSNAALGGGRKIGAKKMPAAVGLPWMPVWMDRKRTLFQPPWPSRPALQRLVDLVKAVVTDRPDHPTGLAMEAPQSLLRVVHRGEARLPSPAHLHLEGAICGLSATRDWVSIRIPLPQNERGDLAVEDWRRWAACAERQLAEADKAIRWFAVCCAGFHGRRTRMPPSAARARAFVAEYKDSLREAIEAAFWTVAAATWNREADNVSQWGTVLDQGQAMAALAAIEALGGLTDPQTLLAASESGLLRLARGPRPRPSGRSDADAAPAPPQEAQP